MEEKLKRLIPHLHAATEDTDALVARIKSETAVAHDTMRQVAEEEAVCLQQAGVAKELRDDCERDLAEAMPVRATLRGCCAAAVLHSCTVHPHPTHPARARKCRSCAQPPRQ